MRGKFFLIIFFLVFYAVLSCAKNKEGTVSVEDAAERAQNSEYVDEEVMEDSRNEEVYVFNIDSFGFLKEFPQTIDEVKEKYHDIVFEEVMQESSMKGLAKFVFSLNSPYIEFNFWGDTRETAKLRVVQIWDAQFQCETVQIIGASTAGLAKLTGKTVDRDGNISIVNDWYILRIKTENEIVVSYTILEQL
jgi:hypothetical protein